MPRAKKERKPAPTAAPQRDGGYRYRDSDFKSMSITLLTHGAGDAKPGLMVNGALLY